MSKHYVHTAEHGHAAASNGTAHLSAANSIESIAPVPIAADGRGHAKAILVANRGEIAIRVMRAGFELGMTTISIYSNEDRLSMHRYKADESYQIGTVGQYSPVQAYLAIDEIVSIASRRGVACIHPGYGFLSENPVFARKVEEAGIAFVGPSAEVIEACGDKTKARALAISAGVPVVPGSNGPVDTLADAEKFVLAHGLPVIIKAANGGGGRGMRVVRDLDALHALFDRARSEALAAFGDATVFIEKLVEKPRHIEVQLLADGQGNVIHLFERDCSVQRRHQKVVEMGPANLPDDVRQSILSDAIKLAKAVGYRNAGTAEFLVDKDNKHYFIEINPRVQVEHCVTEEITGVDIVAAQIQIALGASLPELGLEQSKISLRGFAIQCRVTAEDPNLGFRPDTGRIEQYRTPGGPGVRLDGGPAFTGAVITPHYDSLLVKCICSGHDYQAARRKMLRALAEFRVRGVKNNVQWLIQLLHHPVVAEGVTPLWTTFIDDTPELFDKYDRDRNRGQKLLRFLGDLAINGPRIKGQSGVPAIDYPISIPPIPGVPEPEVVVPNVNGWRPILLRDGPAAFCKAIRAHPAVLITDTTWRDAHQSLLATRVRTIDIARIATATSHVLRNAFSLECWGGATFDVALRFLHECPWDRLSTLRRLVPNVPFQMLLRGANAVGYTAYPDNVVEAFVKKAVEKGMDIFRVFDSLNYEENLRLGIRCVVNAGGVAEGAVSYTGDVTDTGRKRYDVQYYLDLVDRLVADGIHILGIKDMAGLLKPGAARLLIGAIRKRHPDLVIHLHTHDTAGTGVATYLAAIEAGVDIVDVAVDSMSGMTSQPSMGAFLASASSAPSAPSMGIDPAGVRALSTYWSQVRLLYSPFEAHLLSSDASVYEHEMPGGQYTNLQFQARQLGLGEMWESIKVAYAQANRLCGDITKVTPSSKVVGDLAQFMVSQKLSEQDVIDKAETLSFPSSVVEYFQGYLGIPHYGFPEPLRSRILKGRNLKPVEGRPGATMPPLNLSELKATLEEKYGFGKIRDEDVLSAAMYPKVFEEYMEHRQVYGDLSRVPTLHLLKPLGVGDEFTFDLEKGKTLIVRLQALGTLNEATGRRDVFFLLNGEARVVDVDDSKAKKEGGAASSKPKANPSVKGEVGAPMSGAVVEMRVLEGTPVKAGDPVAIMSAMKMETVVTAPVSGTVTVAAVAAGDSLAAGDLIAKIA
ncbi:pyruvate carboxylase [Phlyctochytrium bullatum]|nr:pyruvate carboxylase [Phlyctochytrium bullatum]